MEGSPPRMRGKVLKNRVKSGQPRITPAYAGKRRCRPIIELPSQDHPRVCGEKPIKVFSSFCITGSPPRMRGKVLLQSFDDTRGWDHPRVCGEKQDNGQKNRSGLGSPPRMRGKGAFQVLHYLFVRITPAYAGKRLKRSRSTVPPVAIVPLFPSVCNKPVVSDGSPAGRDAPLFLPAENAVPASPAYNLRSL